MQVLKFFGLFSTWPWPDPVALTDFAATSSEILAQQQQQASANGFMGQQQQQTAAMFLNSWNPDKNPQERHQVRLLLFLY